MTTTFWKRRWRAPKVAKLPRPSARGYTDEHVARARQLKKLDPNLGRGRLAKQLTMVGLPTTEEQARVILSDLRKG